MNLAFIVERFIEHWKKSILFSFLFILISWILINTIPREYQSDATLKVNSFYQINNSTQLDSNPFGSIAALNSDSLNNGADAAIEYFHSRDFQYNLIKSYSVHDHFMIPNNLTESERLDKTYEILKKKLTLTQKDKFINIYQVKFQSYEPEFSRTLIINAIHDLNNELSRADSKTINDRVAYIEDQINSTLSASLINSFSSILEADIKKLILIDTTPEKYIFEFVALPHKSIKKIYPSRAILLLLAMFILTISFPAYYLVKFLVLDIKKQVIEIRNS